MFNLPGNRISGLRPRLGLNFSQFIRYLTESGTGFTVSDFESSNVEAFSYNPRRKRLIVEFKNGRMYQYNGVDSRTVDGLMNSKSKGEYLWGNVIKKYNTKQIR